MADTPIPGLFITGTDTGVGKTYVACRIADWLVRAGYRVGVYKPAASGCDVRDGRLVADDALQLWQAAGRPGDLDHVCPQRFLAPLAPPLAARAEGRHVDADLLRSGLEFWKSRSDIVLVEGAGGLMSPLSDEDYVADLAFDCGFSLIVVAPNVLGVINQTLQTLITAAVFRSRANSGEGLAVAGIVLNDRGRDVRDDPSVESNHGQLVAHCGPLVLARLAYDADEFSPPVDWFAVARGQQASG
ncbi:MAG: dethiobiotin synthase [Pirellulaceae bacterium]|nr:dethiobiotin synthase [Pirellulaceae bacterium]